MVVSVSMVSALAGGDSMEGQKWSASSPVYRGSRSSHRTNLRRNFRLHSHDRCWLFARVAQPMLTPCGTLCGCRLLDAVDRCRAAEEHKMRAYCAARAAGAKVEAS